MAIFPNTLFVPRSACVCVCFCCFSQANKCPDPFFFLFYWWSSYDCCSLVLFRSCVSIIKQQFRVFGLLDETFLRLLPFENCTQLLIAFHCCARLNKVQFFWGGGGTACCVESQKSSARESVVPRPKKKRFTGSGFEQNPRKPPWTKCIFSSIHGSRACTRVRQCF